MVVAPPVVTMHNYISPLKNLFMLVWMSLKNDCMVILINPRGKLVRGQVI